MKLRNKLGDTKKVDPSVDATADARLEAVRGPSAEAIPDPSPGPVADHPVHGIADPRFEGVAKPSTLDPIPGVDQPAVPAACGCAEAARHRPLSAVNLPVTRKRLIIHAGVHRTGTTAVQLALAQSRKTLGAFGVAYPLDPVLGLGDGRNDSPRRNNHLPLAWSLRRKEMPSADLKKWLADVALESDMVVLSAEDFCTIKDLYFVAPLLERFDIEVVFYLRRQDEWLNSWYNQHIHWPFNEELATKTPLQFLNYLDRFFWLRYFNTLERWANLIGRENVHARVCEKGQVTDTINDFFVFCGLPVPQHAGGTRRNESLPADQLEFVRRLRITKYPDELRRNILAALTQVRSTRSTNVYPASIRRLILERYQSQNRCVAKEYLHRPDGVLFRDTEFPSDGGTMDGSEAIGDQLLFGFIEKFLKRCASFRPK